MASITAGISHVGLTVGDLSKTVPFFEAVGFRKIGGDEDYPSVFLSDGSTMVTVWKAKVPDPTPFDRTKHIGLHHLAIKASSMDALNTAYEIVQGIEGVKIEVKPQPIPGTALTQFICYEPCGVRVEFTYHAA